MNVPEDKMERMEQFLRLILEANEKVNLTRISSPEQARILHLEDSLSALPEMEAAPFGLYGDLGTGGGFPGVPLALVTGRQTILVDSVRKKTQVLENVIGEMGFGEQVSTYWGRIEDLARERKGGFAVLTARALSSLPSLLELAAPLLEKNGQLICYKARLTPDELEQASSLERLLAMKLVSRRSFFLSDDETYREILVFEKTGKAKLKLPRRVGLAQKSPLSVG